MIAAKPPDISWYFNTAGVDAGEEYRWLAWESQGDTSTAEFVLLSALAGTPLLQLTSERTPSIVLGRIPDGSFVFFANRLVPPGAPEKGDYQHRPISASVLGVSTPGTDPRPLIATAAAAFEEDLAHRLPLRWTAGNPAIDPEAGQWPPSPRDSPPMPQEPDLHESVGLPWDQRASVAADLISLTAENLDVVPRDHVLVLQTDVLDRDQLRQMRPWRVISSELKEQVTFQRDPKSWHWQFPRQHRRIILICIGTAAVAAFVIWVVSRGRRG
jgi:hypothetical protein